MNQQIVYLMSWPPHLPYLIVSLLTLRKHYKGRVVVYCFADGPEWPYPNHTYEWVKGIAEDKELDIEVREWTTEVQGKNDQFIEKIRIFQSLGNGENIYLDADTTIHGDLQPFFGAVRDYGFVATQWNEWHTHGKMISGRIRDLYAVEEIDIDIVKQTLEAKWPSVNGGIWGSKPDSPILPLWEYWTKAATVEPHRLFIADEKVLHLMQTKFVPYDMFTMCGKGRWNSSPKHKSPNLDAKDVRIFHYHGDCNVRPAKSEEGYNRWWPLYQKCLAFNIGGMRDLRKKMVGKNRNKWMDKLEKEK